MCYRNIAFGLISAVLACTPVLVAQTEGDERFTFAVANSPKTGLGEDRLHVTINRWSTNAERDQFAGMLSENDRATVASTLRTAGAVGYLRWPGGLEYTLRYARRTPRPDGSADVTFVVDSRVWVWWDAKVDVPLEEPFTVFQVRLDKNGVGEGKLAPASKVQSDKAVGFAVSDYDARPVVLTDFRAQRG